jgi:hypothetical protein
MPAPGAVTTTLDATTGGPFCRHDQGQVVHEVIDTVRRTEKGFQAPVRVDDQHDGRVVDAIDALVGASLLEKDPQRVRQLADLVKFAGQAEIVLAEIRDIPGHGLRRITFGIHTHEHNARQGLPAVRSESTTGLAEHGHSRRADIRAVGEAEEDDVPLAFEDRPVDDRTVLVQEREFGQFVAGGEYRRAERRRRLAHIAQREHEACDQGRGEHEGGNDVSRLHEIQVTTIRRARFYSSHVRL